MVYDPLVTLAVFFFFLNKTLDGFDETKDLIRPMKKIHWIFQKTVIFTYEILQISFALADGMDGVWVVTFKSENVDHC